ncbi:hypothetical protein L1I30_01985 [Gillisia sp. M10.2A]|uniref:Ferredoxin subunit of nitrite reductase or a ring-hydroxylating dioxygenase n=1 Tax=Gillisia lutea TaxID=2909668 RepID=A0ABS9EF65_9FLAO|nr:hypothetical protein [Gillisia lutea]MCF4100425.1 hypothetical protein [Gillisia lutea]
MIKKLLYIVVLSSFAFGCSSDTESVKNPYLIETSFTAKLNLSLPEYNSLNFPGNTYANYNYGINGFVVYNINNTQYLAFELTDPNHVVSDCSRLSVNGIIVSCNCNDGNKYNLLTGELTEGSGEYSLKPYRVRKTGNILEVYN